MLGGGVAEAEARTVRRHFGGIMRHSTTLCAIALVCLQIQCGGGTPNAIPRARRMMVGCKTDSDCLPNYYCCQAKDGCGATGTCPIKLLPGHPCATDHQCQDGACVNGRCAFLPQPGLCGGQCVQNQACCGGRCVDATQHLDDDVHCGGCGTPCQSGTHCCFYGCSPLNDAHNCGRCGNGCNQDQKCTQGVCNEIDLSSDPDNCGSLRNHCAANQSCCSGLCVSLRTDTDCGSCGHACTSNQICNAGQCQVGRVQILDGSRNQQVRYSRDVITHPAGDSGSAIADLQTLPADGCLPHLNVHFDAHRLQDPGSPLSSLEEVHLFARDPHELYQSSTHPLSFIPYENAWGRPVPVSPPLQDAIGQPSGVPHVVVLQYPPSPGFDLTKSEVVHLDPLWFFQWPDGKEHVILGTSQCAEGTLKGVFLYDRGMCGSAIDI